MDPQPSMNHHHVVFLQGDFVQALDMELPPPQTYTKTIYPQTSLADLHDRVRDASVLVLSALRIDATTLSPEITPHLKLIVAVAAGTDCIDLDACRKRGIVVSNCPSANTSTVSEHAMGLYFMTRRRMASLNAQTRAGEWPRQKTLMYQMLEKDGTPPLTCQEEVAGIIGNGSVGKMIANMARGLGMKVLISSRKSSEISSAQNGSGNEERTPFDTVIRQSTVLFIAVPLSSSTRDLISTPELEAMSPHTVLVNVSRGGIVDEEALVKALRQGKLSGAATDVFYKEPAGPDSSPLLKEGTEDLNLVVTPHLAWLSRRTVNTYSQLLKKAVEGWARGEPINVVC
ncbi:D-isomer specific 2-hydroxyacid dehydrogenase [Aspergillus ambiguus]|uniref:D-isomer specific 2-hydroxyacid dehydrogenase family protein n=1 Tax=Aspergillus ambiguus TaxID=176160 RepID=UPI003CCDB6C4